MRIKQYWLQILMWITCVVIAVGLFCLIRNDNNKKAERARELQRKAAELEQTDGQKLEAQTDIYDEFYSQVELPGIICWGDSAMAGSKDKSLAISLKTVISDNLFAQLNKVFNRVIDQEGYSVPSISINNMGVTNENMRQILVRAGVNSMEIGEWIQIPSSTNPVAVKLMDEEAWNSENKDAELLFAKQRDVGFGQVWISDIEGTLITTDDWYDSNHPRYAFVRDEEGNQKSVGSGTEVEIESATQYIGDVPIFFFENDSGRSVDGFVSDIEKLVERYADINEEEDEEEQNYDLPYVVICVTKEKSELDIALTKMFGDQYIRINTTSSEMTDRKYKQLAQQVYENLDNQGCFNDVKAKLALAVEEAEGL